MESYRRHSSYMLKLERSRLASQPASQSQSLSARPCRAAARPPMASISNSAKEEGSTAAVGAAVERGPTSLSLLACLLGLHGLSWAQCSGG